VHLALITPEELRPLVATRLAETHKGTYGQVVIVGGSPGRAGAAVLAARGATRTGAGLVQVATDAGSAAIVTGASPETMTAIVGRDVDAAAAVLKKKSAVLVGPGLPDDDEAYAFIRALIGTIDIPSVIDASALNAFAGRAAELNPRGTSRVLTPHPRELSRLLGRTTDEVQGDRIGAAREAAKLTGCIVVLKGHLTLIAEPDGHVAVNPTGNPGMATGGTGDVLGGAIAALLARGNDPFEAACAGVYLHGLAGDLAKDDLGDTGLAALDVAERIPLAIRKLRGE
jgi:NAD(P)H-hydrate epimerase